MKYWTKNSGLTQIEWVQNKMLNNEYKEVFQYALDNNLVRMEVIRKEVRFWIKDGYYSNREWLIYRISDFPKTIRELKTFKPKKYSKIFMKRYPELTLKQFYIDYTIALHKNGKIYLQAISAGILDFIEKNNSQEYSPIIKDCLYDKWWPIKLKQLPDTIEGFINYKPKKYIQNKLYPNYTQKDFFLDYSLPFKKNGDLALWAIKNGYAKVVYNKRNNTYTIAIKDCFQGRFWNIDLRNLPSTKERYMNYYPLEYRSIYKEWYNLDHDNYTLQYVFPRLKKYNAGKILTKVFYNGVLKMKLYPKGI